MGATGGKAHVDCMAAETAAADDSDKADRGLSVAAVDNPSAVSRVPCPAHLSPRPSVDRFAGSAFPLQGTLLTQE